MSGITKKQAARVVDLATLEELQQFYEWNKAQQILAVFGEWAAIDELARKGRKLCRQILRRDMP